ncbi:MAG: MBL fold metallo-hydrolase [Chryseolinea sp.]
MKKYTARYTNNPQLLTPRSPEGWPGTPLTSDGQFQNVNHPYSPKWMDVFRWKFNRNPYLEIKKSEVFNPEVLRDENWLNGNGDIIVWLGHSTFYIRINGSRLLTDPVFGNIPAVKRMCEFPINPNLLRDLDYILISHDHRDHFDEPSLKTLAKNNPSARYVSGLNMKPLIHQFTSSTNIEEAGWYQQYSQSDKGVTITFVPSRHWSRRGLNDTNRRLWGGFVIEANGQRIYFGGDSGYDSHYRELQSVFKDFTIAILGIGAYEPEWFMSPNHQSPADALKGFIELNGDNLIPMHYGTFDLSDEPMSQPLKDLRAAAAELSLTEKLNILNIGQPLIIR